MPAKKPKAKKNFTMEFGFQCIHKDCKAGMNQQFTRAGREYCHVCERPRKAAINARPDEMAPWAMPQEQSRKAAAGSIPGAPPSKGNKKTAKRSQRRAAKEAATTGKETKTKEAETQKSPPPPPPPKGSTAATAPAASSTGEEAEAGPMDETPKTLRALFDDERLSDWVDIRPALEPTLAALKKEMFPAKPSEARETPEETIAKSIKTSSSLAASNAEAEAEIAKLRAAVEPVKDSDDPEVVAMKELLARKEAALAKANRATPSAELELKALQAAKSKFAEDMQVCEDRVRNTAEAAQKRKDERHAKLLQMRQQLDDFISVLAANEVELQKEHKHRAEARTEYQTTVMSLFQEKIAAAERKVAPSQNGPTANSAASNNVTATQSAPQTQHRQQLDAQQKTLDDMQKQIGDMQKAYEEARRQAAARKARILSERKAADAFQAFVPSVTVETLPSIPVPKADQLEKYGQLHILLGNWKAAGGMEAFTLQDLIDHSAFGQDVVMVLASILGSQHQKWFSTNAQSGDTVPRQVAMLCWESLERLKENWEEKEALKKKIQEESAGSYASFSGAAKRRRAIDVDADMA